MENIVKCDNSAILLDKRYPSSTMRAVISSCLGLLAATAAANPLDRRQSTTAVVNFANNTGTPQHLASGTLYGLPDVLSQIPSNFFTDIGWN